MLIYFLCRLRLLPKRREIFSQEPFQHFLVAHILLCYYNFIPFYVSTTSFTAASGASAATTNNRVEVVICYHYNHCYYYYCVRSFKRKRECLIISLPRKEDKNNQANFCIILEYVHTRR